MIVRFCCKTNRPFRVIKRCFIRFAKSVVTVATLGILLTIGFAQGQEQPTKPIPGESSGNLSASPRKKHKLRVADKETAAQITKEGGELIADYGSFQLFEADDAVAEEVKRRNGAQDADEQNRIALNTGVLDTSAPETQSLRRLAGAFSGKRLHLVQFAGPIQPDWRAELEQSGVRIVAYIPHNAYLVYGDTGGVSRMQARTRAARHVQWDGDYLDDYKIHPRARSNQQADPEAFITDLFAIQLVDDLEANAATLQLIDQIKLAPIKRQFTNMDYLNVIVRLPSERLAEIAARPEVVSIQPYIVPRQRDERQDQIIAGNLTGSSPSGPGYLAWLTGKGFTQAQFTASGFAVDVTDSGLDNATTTPGHFGLYQFGDTNLSSRIIYNRLEGTPNTGSTLQGCDGHGTLNSHIIAGYNNQPNGFPHTDSSGFHYGLGVSPFVKVGSSVIFDPGAYTFPNFNNLQSKAYQDGARVSANSWGADTAGAYNVDAQNYDRLVRDAQPSGSTFATSGNQEMVIVFAAGNAGPSAQTVGSPGTAKNVITVGATENVHSFSTANGGNNASGNDGSNIPDSSANNANDMAGFSSRGPCSDGRKKPDIVAPGTHVTGGVAQNSPAPSASGTGSAISCFVASGVSALPGKGAAGSANNFFPLGQQFFTTSSGTSHSTPAVAGACALLRQYFINNGLNPPTPAMTKACLMNSARYLNGSGANDSLWSNNQGMGELNLGFAFDGALRILRDQLAADKFTATGQTRVFTGTISNSAQPFRVTLAWTDAPGNTAGNAFNNDLDLTVFVGENIYKGNVFNGANSITGGANDSQNNVESVFLPAGTTGDFVVTVTAANINSDGVPNQLPDMDQDFALVIYNATEIFVPVITVSSTTVMAENCGQTNAAIDPGETVTVNFALNNIGAASTTNLVVTLLSTNGVTALSGPKIYGALATGGVSVTQAFSFTASGTCGGSLPAILQLQDGSQDLGTVSQNFILGKAVLSATSRTNATSISIPDMGAASPFPSSISVSSITGSVSKVTATLRGLTHTWPDDLDILLVGPGGQKVMLMSDAGGGNDVNGITLTFDDSASSSLPDNSQITSGTYKPSDFIAGDTFSSPAPGGPYGSTLSVFNGLNPNGTWSLYVEDDGAVDIGTLSQGWSLSITTSNVSCCTMPVTDLALKKVVSTNFVNIGSNLTFTLTVTNGGPDAAPGVVVTDILPAGLQFVSAIASQGDCTNNGGVVTCSLNSLNAGNTATITIEAFAAASGNWTNTASVAADVVDPVSPNNTASAAVFIDTPPTISNISDQQTDEDTPTTPLAFTIGDAETAAASLVVFAFSSDTNLVSETGFIFGGSDINRTLTITPATNIVGSATITVIVSDGLAQAVASFTLVVIPHDDVPILASIPDFTLFEGALLTFTNSAADSEAPPQTLTFSLANQPAGASIGPTNGAFNWTPDESQGPSTNLISVIVTDNGVPSLSATQTFTVFVLETNSPPQLLPLPEQIVAEGDTLVVTNSASDTDIPANTLIFSLGTNAPVDADFNPTNGVFKWTPGESRGPGTNVITVIVTDNGSPSMSATQTFTVIVLEANTAPGLSPITDRTILEGETLTVANNAGDTDIPANTLMFSLKTNAPAGMEINSTNGLLVWTPFESQGPSTNLIAVIVTDDGSPSLSTTQTFTVFVLETDSLPALAAISNYTIIEGETLTFTNTASDGDLPANTLTFALENAPANATINTTTGVFDWTPDEAQGPSTNLMAVVVTDDGSPSLSSTQTFTVFVLESNSPPVLAAISDRTVYAGTTLFITNTVTDADIPANALTFSLVSNPPPAATIEAANGVLAWTPDIADTNAVHTITVRVTDDGSPPLFDEKSFLVTVLTRPVMETISISNDVVTITWSAIGGQTYRLQFQTNIVGTNWNDIPPDVTATGPTATNTDTISTNAERYYRVRLLP